MTTKKGAKGQPAQVTYDAYYGFQEPWKKIALLNAEEYAILMNESRASAGLVPYAQLAEPASLGEGTDWQDALFQRAPIMNHSFNFTKGTATSSTAIGGSHFVQDGIIGGEKGRFERTTFRISSQQEAGDRFRIGQTVNFTHLNRNALAENNEFATPVVRALNMDPVTPVTRPDGSYAYSELIGSDIANPINQVETTHDKWTTNRFVGNLYGEYDIWQNLKVRSSMNVDLSLGSQKIFFPTFDLGIGPNDPNRPAYEWREVNGLIRNENKWSTWQWENTATYDKDFENGDRIQAIFGYSALYGNYQNIGTYRDSLNSNDPELAFLDNSLNFNEQAPNASGGYGESSYLSSFARIQYELGDRYSFSGTIRRDGSSKFGANNRYGIFLSTAWNLTEFRGSSRRTGSSSPRCASGAMESRRHRQLRLHLRRLQRPELHLRSRPGAGQRRRPGHHVQPRPQVGDGGPVQCGHRPRPVPRQVQRGPRLLREEHQRHARRGPRARRGRIPARSHQRGQRQELRCRARPHLPR